jgi:hypothetical protein
VFTKITALYPPGPRRVPPREKSMDRFQQEALIIVCLARALQLVHIIDKHYITDKLYSYKILYKIDQETVWKDVQKS